MSIEHNIHLADFPTADENRTRPTKCFFHSPLANYSGFDDIEAAYSSTDYGTDSAKSGVFDVGMELTMQNILDTRAPPATCCTYMSLCQLNST